MAHTTQVIQRCIRGNPPHPPEKIALFCIEARTCPVHPPEGLHGQLFGCGPISHDSDDPAEHFALVLPEQALERVRVSRCELLQHLHSHALHLPLLSQGAQGYMLFCRISKTKEPPLTTPKQKRPGLSAGRFVLLKP